MYKVLSTIIFATVMLFSDCNPIPQPPPPQLATLKYVGVELPTMGASFLKQNCNSDCVNQEFFAPNIMSDIKGKLGADFVRSEWIPQWVNNESPKWKNEDYFMDNACGAGLRVMIIVPGIGESDGNQSEAIASIKDFFSRYTSRDPGCIGWAEIVNEADLPVNGYATVSDYASYYIQAAPLISPYGIPIITSGTSGEDISWTVQLSTDLYNDNPKPPLNGFGYHPYGTTSYNIAQSIMSMYLGVHGSWSTGLCTGACIYITEFGDTDSTDIYNAIIAMDRSTPVLNIYEYKSQPSENPQYGLVDNPELYSAVQKAFAYIHMQK